MTELFFKGAAFGMVTGCLAWFAGWLVNKILKLFTYIAR
jgi:hypothetical protein